jgi:hypothetical protein
MTKDEALKLALEALNDLSAWTDGEVGGHMDEPYSAEVARRTISSIKEALAQPEQEPVQVSPLEFVEMVMEKEHLIGNPIFWAEWPNKEKNT